MTAQINPVEMLAHGHRWSDSLAGRWHQHLFFMFSVVAVRSSEDEQIVHGSISSLSAGAC